MPKVDIDYSNTIIYKITCKDPSITDVYVGHTTNFVQRKHAHKQSCVKEQCKLYTTIRNNGGWINWTMEIINFFNCKDHYEARIKEQEYFELLRATLNSIQPMPKPKCEPIKEDVVNENVINEDEKDDVKEPAISTDSLPNNFYCKCCKLECKYKSNWDRHIMSSKHITQSQIESNFTAKNKIWCKGCDKKFKTNAGLWKHKSKGGCVENVCVPLNETNELLININKKNDIIIMLLKQNADLIEIIKNKNPNIV
jgi:hypothetical protein